MTNPAIQHVLQFFDYKHLRQSYHLGVVSEMYLKLAHVVARQSPDSPETTVALRKLLEAKDVAVRAAVEVHKDPKSTLVDLALDHRVCLDSVISGRDGETPKPELAPSKLPRYKCHKEVGAFKIARRWEVRGAHRGADLYDDADPRRRVYVSQAFIDKHNPKVGDYYVEYDGGYASISPAKAFEEGYTLIPTSTGNDSSTVNP